MKRFWCAGNESSSVRMDDRCPLRVAARKSHGWLVGRMVCVISHQAVSVKTAPAVLAMRATNGTVEAWAAEASLFDWSLFPPPK